MLQLGPPARLAGPAGPGPGVTRGQRPALVQGPGQPQVQVQQSLPQFCWSSLPSLLSRRPPRSDSPSFSTAILRSRDATKERKHKTHGGRGAARRERRHKTQGGWVAGGRRSWEGETTRGAKALNPVGLSTYTGRRGRPTPKPYPSPVTTRCCTWSLRRSSASPSGSGRSGSPRSAYRSSACQ